MPDIRDVQLPPPPAVEKLQNRRFHQQKDVKLVSADVHEIYLDQYDAISVRTKNHGLREVCVCVAIAYTSM